MHVEGPSSGVAAQCERVLRTLPRWFGIESALLQYVHDTSTYPTFVTIDQGQIVGFLTTREHFPQAWEVHCLAVAYEHRGRGMGRALHTYVEDWLRARGVRMLQVKTMAATHPSAEYAETRQFYSRIGYIPLEVFPQLWGPTLPVVQLVKVLDTAARLSGSADLRIAAQ